MKFARRRLENFRKVLNERGLDAIILANYYAYAANGGSYNLYYISNLLQRFANCFLIFTEDEYGMWVESSELERARRDSWLDGIQPMEDAKNFVVHTPDEFANVFRKHVREMVGKEDIKVGVDGRYLQSSVVLSLFGKGIRVTNVSQDLEKSHLVKDTKELETLRQATRIVDIGVEKVMEAIRAGMTEAELAALAEYAMRKAGADCFWWKTLVNSGGDAQSWADCPTRRKIMNGDVVGMDFAPVYEGYGADMGRTFVYGNPSSEQMKVLELTKKSLDEGVSVLREGVTIKEIIEAATGVVKGSPYAKFFTGPGHGIGLYNEVYPLFFSTIAQAPHHPKSILDMKLAKGVTVAMEIVFTVPGVGRVCIEDDYLVKSKGAERLTNAEITFNIAP